MTQNKLLNKKYIDSLKPQDKDYCVWDLAITGFGCKVTPKGRKVFLYLYRNADKKKVRLTLGKYGPITVEMARAKVRSIISKINDGVDIQQEKQQAQTKAKTSILFKDFWDVFERKHRATNKKTTVNKSRSRVSYILDYFGKMPVGDIQRTDMLDFEKYLEKKNVGISVFTKCWKELLSPAFNHAELWGYREENTNPCKKLSRYKSKAIENYLDDSDLARLEHVLADIDCQYPQNKALIALSFYTGIRQGQLKSIRWDQVDFKHKIMIFDQTKTGRNALPINPKAEEWFQWVQQFQQPNNPYVFPGKFAGTHMQSSQSLWLKVRKLAKIENKRWHDLRHSFASFALKNGVDLYTVSKLLGHKNITTTTRYAHLELDALKAASNKVFG